MVNPDAADSKRDRGILTASDREFLKLSESKRKERYSAPARSQRRRAISNRVQNALLDFQLLHDELDNEICDEIFGSLLGHHISYKGNYNSIAGRAIQANISFLYAGTINYASDRSIFETLLQNAIETTEAERGKTMKNFQFDVETEIVLSWDDIKQDIEDQSLTPHGLRSFMYHLMNSQDEIDTATIVDVFENFKETDNASKYINRD